MDPWQLGTRMLPFGFLLGSTHHGKSPELLPTARWLTGGNEVYVGRASGLAICAMASHRNFQPEWLQHVPI